MTGDPNHVATLLSFKGGTVIFGDNSKGKIISIGTIGKKPFLLLKMYC